MRACSVSEQDSHIPLDRRMFLRGCLGGGAGSMSSGSPSFSMISAISASQARAIAAQLFSRTKLGEYGAVNFRHLAKRLGGLGPPLDFSEHEKQSFSRGCPIAIVFIWTKEI